MCIRDRDYLAEIYLHYQTIHIDELIGPKGKNQKNMRDLDPKDVYPVSYTHLECVKSKQLAIFRT